MDRTDIAGLLFGFVGIASLLQLVIDPVSGSAGIISALLGVGFLALGAANILRERRPVQNASRSVVLPAIAATIFALGVGVSFVM